MGEKRKFKNTEKLIEEFEREEVVVRRQVEEEKSIEE